MMHPSTDTRHPVHTAIAVCRACSKPMPHDAPVCRCGALAPRNPSRVKQATDGAVMLDRLACLSEGIGWSEADAGSLQVAVALHLQLTIHADRDQPTLLVEDRLLGVTVFEAHAALSVEQAQAMLAEVARAHVLRNYGPIVRSTAKAIRPNAAKLQEKLDFINRTKPQRRQAPVDAVALAIRKYRDDRGIMDARKLNFPVTKRGRLLRSLSEVRYLPGTEVPWGRLTVNEWVGVDLSDVSTGERNSELRRQKALRDAWRTDTPGRSVHHFQVRLFNTSLVIQRTS